MKCMKLGDTVKRVGEKEVNSLLHQGWNYCSKTEWKEYRGVQPQTKDETTEKKKGKQNLKGKAKKETI